MPMPNTGLKVTPRRKKQLAAGWPLTEREFKYAVRVGKAEPQPHDLERMRKADAKRARKAAKFARQPLPPGTIDAIADGTPMPEMPLYNHRTHQMVRR